MGKPRGVRAASDAQGRLLACLRDHERADERVRVLVGPQAHSILLLVERSAAALPPGSVPPFTDLFDALDGEDVVLRVAQARGCCTPRSRRPSAPAG